ncbi:MAG: ABC transporter permease, partial [Planctomycetota bacterium]
MSAIAALVQRDLIRLVRRPSQLVATAGVPLLFAFVLGSGFDRAEITGAGAGYAAYLVPGTALLAVVFAATFAGMALIEDRNEGALRAIMLSPASPASIAAARLLSALILSLLPATLILITGALFGRIDFTPGVLATVAALALGSVAIGGISLALAWAIDSQRGFHGVLNLGLMPGWLLSGAVFPIDAASGWV